MLKIPAYFMGFASKVDKSASLRFCSQELTGTEFSELQNLNGAFGWLLFKENQFTDNDLPTEQAEDKDKTPSKRLRSVLFILWKQQGEKGDFEQFYREKMNKLIDMVKSKLD